MVKFSLLEFVRGCYSHFCRLDVNFHIPFAKDTLLDYFRYYEKKWNDIINRLKVTKLHRCIFSQNTLANTWWNSTITDQMPRVKFAGSMTVEKNIAKLKIKAKTRLYSYIADLFGHLIR